MSNDVKIQPSSSEAEDGVLGAILLDDTYANFEKAMAWVRKPDVFYYSDSKRVWKAMIQLYKDREPIDIITVTNKVKENNSSDPLGYYVSGLPDHALASNIETYARIIYERFIQRETAKSAQKLYNISHTSHEDSKVILEEHTKLIQELKEIQPSRSQAIEDIVTEAVSDMKEGKHLIPFGLEALDAPANGMTRKEITVLGGRPGHGKTTLMVNIVKSIVEQGYNVMMFNREMSNSEMIKKLIVLESDKLLYNNLRQNDLNLDDYVEIDEVAERLVDKYSNLKMYDSVRILPDCMREIQKYNPDVIVDDYIQLIDVPDEKERRFQIEKIMQEYKWVCKAENCSALLVSQLNREIERRIEPRPRLSDYAESGVIEQTAEAAIFVFYGYNFNSEEYSKYECEIISAKSRYGKIGRYSIGFGGDRCKFFNTSQEAKEDYETVSMIHGDSNE